MAPELARDLPERAQQGPREQALARLRAEPARALERALDQMPQRVPALLQEPVRQVERRQVLGLPQGRELVRRPELALLQAVVREPAPAHRLAQVHQLEQEQGLARVRRREQAPVRARALFEQLRPEQRAERAGRVSLARRAARTARAVPVRPVQQAAPRVIPQVQLARAGAMVPAQWAAARPAARKPRKNDGAALIVA